MYSSAYELFQFFPQKKKKTNKKKNDSVQASKSIKMAGNKWNRGTLETIPRGCHQQKHNEMNFI